MADVIIPNGVHKGAGYAACQARIIHPGSAAEKAADEATGLIDLQTKLGQGVDVDAIDVDGPA